jgi:hypothetical protein
MAGLANDRRRGVALATVLALAATVALAETAGAVSGTYDVHSCAMPDGTAAPVDGWRTFQSGWGGYVGNQCPRFGLRASFAGQNGTGDRVGWIFDAPPGTVIQNLTVFRAERSGTLEGGLHSANLTRALDGYSIWTDAVLDWCGPVSGNCTQRGDFNSPFAAANRAQFTDIARPHLYAYVQCHGPGDQCPASALPGQIVIFAATIGLRDLVSPTISGSPDGSLLNPTVPLEGEKTVTFEAHDEGGGLTSVGVLVDGVPAVEQPADATSSNCRPPYVVRIPCPLAARTTLRVDTANLANGIHLVEAFATDVGGNRTTSRPFLVATQNGGEPNGAGASRLAELTVSRRSRAPRVLGHRARATLAGQLRLPSGSPISGAEVRVHTLTALRGATWRDLPPVLTDSNGRFRFVARPGPSRTLRFTYHAFSLDSEPAATADLDLRVRAGLAFTVRPRRVASRGRITFQGRLLGGPGRAGDQIALYAVARRGQDRVPVAVVRTDRRGHFRFIYRFRRTFAPFTYRFRAKLPTQAGYPYVGAWSRTVAVRVVR